MKGIYFLRTIIVFGLIISSVSSLRCYQCDEQNDSDCKHLVQTTMIKECPIKYHGPNKIPMDATGCTILLLTQNDPSAPTSTQRMCFYDDVYNKTNLLQRDGCRSNVESIYKPHLCNVCEGDLCNSKSIIHSANIVILLLAFVFTYISVN